MKPNKPKPTASGSTHHKSRRSVVPNPLFVEAAACATVHSCASVSDQNGDNIADNSASVQQHFQNAAFRGSLKGAPRLRERKGVGNEVKHIDAPRSQQIQRWFKTAAPRSNESDFVDDDTCRVEWRGSMNGGLHEYRSSGPHHPDRLIQSMRRTRRLDNPILARTSKPLPHYT